MSMSRQLQITRTSGSTTGTQSVSVVAANLSRQGLLFQNTSDTAMQIEFGAAAVATSLNVAAGASVTFDMFVDWRALNVYCSASSKTFVCLEAA